MTFRDFSRDQLSQELPWQMVHSWWLTGFWNLNPVLETSGDCPVGKTQSCKCRPGEFPPEGKKHAWGAQSPGVGSKCRHGFACLCEVEALWIQRSPVLRGGPWFSYSLHLGRYIIHCVCLSVESCVTHTLQAAPPASAPGAFVLHALLPSGICVNPHLHLSPSSPHSILSWVLSRWLVFWCLPGGNFIWEGSLKYFMIQSLLGILCILLTLFCSFIWWPGSEFDTEHTLLSLVKTRPSRDASNLVCFSSPSPPPRFLRCNGWNCGIMKGRNMMISCLCTLWKGPHGVNTAIASCAYLFVDVTDHLVSTLSVFLILCIH